MLGYELAALEAVHDAHARPVAYLPRHGALIDPLPAVRIDMAAPEFQGAGETLRSVIFEVMYHRLEQRPAKGDAIQESPLTPGKLWKVTEITDRDDVQAWHLRVEETAG